eukprot:TRINITY_DN4281_c0_g1_i4.p1 TRINITY_DN4281_c0_g1~~TRINITY_DN4281_c0_g1_i4.p1  ORF type:complete len:106 (+),score=1.13 TRINITY_DN4281_c0_g1_i4:490-807(+)
MSMSIAFVPSSLNLALNTGLNNFCKQLPLAFNASALKSRYKGKSLTMEILDNGEVEMKIRIGIRKSSFTMTREDLFLVQSFVKVCAEESCRKQFPSCWVSTLAAT